MSGPGWRLEDNVLVLDVRVQPRASRDQVTGFQSGRLRVRVGAPPVDDAANQRLKELIAREFGVSVGRVRILSGETSRDKRVSVKEPKRTPRWLEGG